MSRHKYFDPAYDKAARVGDAWSITAGGGGDNTAKTTPWIPREDFKAVLAVVQFVATLAATKTLSLTVLIKDAEDSSGTNARTLETFAADVVATGPGGGGTIKGVRQFGASLEMGRSHIAITVTPDLNATGTDTAILGAVLILSGGHTEPPTAPGTSHNVTA